MKKQSGFRKLIAPVVLISIFFLIMKYQDTPAFQNAMTFLFNPDKDMALPVFWQNHRFSFFATATLILLLYYKPVWLTYRNLARIYRSSPEEPNRPDLPVLQAGYFYHQDQTTSMVVFLVDLCRRGFAVLHYNGGNQPWSISRKPGDSPEKISSTEKRILGILFRSGETVRLKARVSDPNPDVKEAAEELFEELKENSKPLYRKNKSPLPAILFLLIVLAEIPFFIAGQPSQMPAAFAIVLVSALLAAVLAYVICSDFPAWFNKPELPVFIKLVFILLFFPVSHLILFSGGRGIAAWRSIALFPDLAAFIITAVYKVPLLPENHVLLQQIIGYRKSLNRPEYLIREEDLPWTLALGLHTGFLKNKISYKEETLPEWIHTEKENDTLSLVKLLHQTLPIQVSQAINGILKSDNSMDVGNGDLSNRF